MSIKSKCPACRKLIKGACERCKRSRLKSQKRRYARLKANSLCTTCGEPTDSNKTRCKTCRDKEKRIIKIGDCTKCGVSRKNKKFVIRKNLCRDCAAKQAKEYHTKNPQRNAEKHSKYIQSNFKNWLRVSFITAKARSKRVNAEFAVTLDDIMEILNRQHEFCALTGIPLTHTVKDLKAASIDRINSDHGYIKNNIQIVCKAINLAKNTHSNKEMLAFIEIIKAHTPDKNTV